MHPLEFLTLIFSSAENFRWVLSLISLTKHSVDLFCALLTDFKVFSKSVHSRLKGYKRPKEETCNFVVRTWEQTEQYEMLEKLKKMMNDG